MTPEAGWWTKDPLATTYPVAAMYRELPSNYSQLLINSTISFNPTSISDPFTFAGDINFLLLNSNLEDVIHVYIRDGFGSSGNHNIFHRAWYIDVNGVSVEIERSVNTNKIVNNGTFSIRIENGSLDIYSPVVESWVTLGNTDTLLQRGNPRYLLVIAERSVGNPLPTEFNIDFIETVTDSKTISDSITSSQISDTTTTPQTSDTITTSQASDTTTTSQPSDTTSESLSSPRLKIPVNAIIVAITISTIIRIKYKSKIKRI